MPSRSHVFSSIATVAASVTIVILLASYIEAQVLTGNLFGSVKDPSGAVLPAATVRVISRALVRGTATTVTNDKGQFRVPELPPGLYRLEVESSVFASYQEDEIRIEVGASTERNVILPVATIKETITVSTSLSSLDPRRIGLSDRF